MEYDEYMEKSTPVIKFDADLRTRMKYLLLSEKDKLEIKNMVMYTINHRYGRVGK